MECAAVLCNHVEKVGIMGAPSVIEAVTSLLKLSWTTSHIAQAGLEASGELILCSQTMMLSEFKIIGIWRGLGRTNEA